MSGHVKNYGEKWVAKRTRSNVVGVKAIVEEVEVRSAGNNPCSHDGIANDASN